MHEGTPHCQMVPHLTSSRRACASTPCLPRSTQVTDRLLLSSTLMRGARAGWQVHSCLLLGWAHALADAFVFTTCYLLLATRRCIHLEWISCHPNTTAITPHPLTTRTQNHAGGRRGGVLPCLFSALIVWPILAGGAHRPEAQTYALAIKACIKVDPGRVSILQLDAQLDAHLRMG